MEEFVLTENQQAAVDEFRENHRVEKGFKYSITFTPTGIGTNVEIKCLNCGRKEDITDYSVW